MSEISTMLGGAPAAKFKSIGDEVKGTIIEEPRVEQQTDFVSGKLKFWDDGSPAKQIVLTIQSDSKEDADDDGQRRIYVKSNLQKSLKEALRAVRAREPKVGGYVTVKFTSEGERERGKQPPKFYDVTYVPPEDNDGDEPPF